MSTINNKSLDTNNSSSLVLTQVKASRFNRFINYLATTFRYGSVAKELSNIKHLTDETAKNHIDLTCRQIRSSKDFSEALKFAQNAKESIHLLDHYQTYIHTLGEALIDQVAEHQGIKMTRTDQISDENQTHLNDAIISIVDLTRFASGTPEIVRSKIGKRLEENLTAQELIRSYKDAFKAKFLKEASPKLLDQYAKLEIKNNLNPSFAERNKINFQKRQLFKERNKFLNTYRLQLQTLGLQGVYDDIKMPNVLKESIKVNEENRRNNEYTVWAEVKAHYERAYSDLKQKTRMSAPSTTPATNRDGFEKTTVLFANNSPLVTANEQNEIEFEKIEIKQSVLDRIKDFFKNPDPIPPMQMEDLTNSLFDEPHITENTTAHFKAQVLPELEEVLRIDDTEHDDFLMPENNDLENHFKPTFLQRIVAAPKEFFSTSENLPVPEYADLLKSPFEGEDESLDDESYDQTPNCTLLQRKTAMDLVNKHPEDYASMADAIQAVLDKEKADASIITIDEG